MHCYDLMTIPSFKDIKLVAGKSGLGRKVSWVYVLHTESLENWVYGGEVLFIVNSENITKTIEDAILHNISCAVILKDKENNSVITGDIKDISNKNNLPLFEMDYNLKLIDVTRQISTYIIQKQEKNDYLNYFFQEILFSDTLTDEDRAEFFTTYGFHSDHQFFIAVLKNNDVMQLSNLKTMFNIYTAEDNAKFLSTIINGAIVFLCFGLPAQIDNAKQSLKNAFSIVSEKTKDKLYMGIGNRCYTLINVHFSYAKSKKALTLCSNENRLIDYEELGFYRLLLNTVDLKELEDYTEHVLGVFKKYDKINQTSFLQTIESYVINNGNINRISSDLHIHRNTCLYRLSKIKELFHIDLEDPYIRADIINCISITEFLNKKESQKES